MRIIVDVVHPANVLFFLRPVRALIERGDEVLILSRHKDVAISLLDAHGLRHVPVSRAGTGLAGLARELVVRDLNVLRQARQFRPHVMIGFGGVAISHAGRLLGIPAISFYDTEIATRQTSITWPFISHVYVPESYRGALPAGRSTRVPGIKELSYFHPSAFRPEKAIAIRNGLDPDKDNFFVRVVSWRANHDAGKSGWPEAALLDLVDRLSRRGRVHISAERAIPEALRAYRYSGSSADIHHVLACCRLYVGESATMACEAAVLGTQSIYASDDYRGYIDELSQAGLIAQVPDASVPRLGQLACELLDAPSRFEQAHSRYLADRPDWAQIVLEAIDRHALGSPR